MSKAGNYELVEANFNGNQIDFINFNDELWLTAEAIGLGLEYKNPRIAVMKLYSSHKDEEKIITPQTRKQIRDLVQQCVKNSREHWGHFWPKIWKAFNISSITNISEKLGQKRVRGIKMSKCKFAEKCDYYNRDAFTCRNRGGTHCGMFRHLSEKEINSKPQINKIKLSQI